MPQSTLWSDAKPAISTSLADDAFVVVDIRDASDGRDADLIERDFALRRHANDAAIFYLADQECGLAGGTCHHAALAGVELDAVDKGANRQRTERVRVTFCSTHCQTNINSVLSVDSSCIADTIRGDILNVVTDRIDRQLSLSQ